jgi:hypothetical protein
MDPQRPQDSPPPPPPPPAAPPPQQPPAAPHGRPARPDAGRNTRISLVAGVSVLAVGLWLLLGSFGVPVPPLERHWPVFLLLGGAASLLDWARVSRRPGSLGQAVAGFGLGILFYLMVFDRLPWRDADAWWPALFLVAGLAWLATWAAGGRRSSRHFSLGLVSVGLALTGWGWQLVRAEVMWAVILLAIGGFLVWRTLRHGGS